MLSHVCVSLRWDYNRQVKSSDITLRRTEKHITPMSLLVRRALLRRSAPLALKSVTRRCFRSSGGPRLHGYPKSEVDPETAIKVTFVDRDGNELPVEAPPGKSLLEIAHANEIDLEGACEGSLACSTCHVYLDEESFAKLEEPCDDENDMLDLAFGLSEVYVI